MITLDIPTDSALLAAVGKVALRHGQLDYVLRMTVKSILKLSIRDALDATDRQGSRGLRDRVRKLAKKRFGEGDTLVPGLFTGPEGEWVLFRKQTEADDGESGEATGEDAQ